MLLMKTASCLQEAFRCILVWIFMIRIRQEEFLPILEEPDSYLVRISRPNGYEQKVFQYIGVARKDQRGLCRWGWLLPECWRLKEKPAGVYIVAYAPGFRDYAFTVDKDTQKVLIYYNERMDEYDLSEFGATPDALASLSSGVFMEGGRPENILCNQGIWKYSAWYGKTSKALYKDRNLQLFFDHGLSHICMPYHDICNQLAAENKDRKRNPPHHR